MDEPIVDFPRVHEEYRSAVQRYLARLVGEGEAEDLTQEVFLRISRALRSFRGECKMSSWVYRIATNTAVDRLLSPAFNRVEPSGLLDSDDADDDAVGQERAWLAEDPLSVEMQVFRGERAECYQDFIRRLPLNYRTVVALSELGGLATAEIADILGLSPNAVKVRLHRGRARLLQELRDHCRAEDWL